MMDATMLLVIDPQREAIQPVTSNSGDQQRLAGRSPVAARGRRVVFVNSMSDLFHARVPLDFVRYWLAVVLRLKSRMAARAPAGEAAPDGAVRSQR